MNIIEELGLKPVINAAGTLTLLGGSIMDEDVTNAMMEASKVYIDMNELYTSRLDDTLLSSSELRMHT